MNTACLLKLGWDLRQMPLAYGAELSMGNTVESTMVITLGLAETLILASGRPWPL